MFRRYSMLALGLPVFAPPTDGGGASDGGGEPASDASTPVELTDAEVASTVLANQGLSEEISENELMGIDPDAKDPDDKDDKDPDDKDDKDPDNKDDKDPDNKDDADPENKDDKDPENKDDKDPENKDDEDPENKDDTPPKGYVPLQAVKEVRSENAFLKGQMATLQDQVTKLLSGKAEPKAEPKKEEIKLPEEVKELSAEEFKDLAEESPAEALLYTQKLMAYQSAVHRKAIADINAANEEKEAKDYESYVTGLLASANDAMEKIVPGIFDKDSEGQTQIVDFAAEIGFKEDLFFLTNPQTMVIAPGEDEPRYLGMQAADILNTLAKAQKLKTKSADNVDVDKLVEDKLKEKETALRATITAELTAKFKNANPKSSFKSLDDIPDADNDRPEFKDTVLSETQLAKLAEKDPKAYEAYLAGE